MKSSGVIDKISALIPPGLARQLKAEWETLVEENAVLKRLHFGTKSERHVAAPESQEELGLFNEAEQLQPQQAEESDATSTEAIDNSTPIDKKQRVPAGRKPLPAHLPREVIRHRLSEEEKKCPCCGKERPQLGEEVTEELEYIPAKVIVHQHVRETYGACSCAAFTETDQQAVMTAPGPQKIVPGSQFSNQSIASFLIAKFIDGLPFYRQESITERAGFRVSRQTMAYLAVKVGSKLGPLIDLMIADTNRSPVLRMDETTVQVLKEIGRKPQAKSYVWVSYAYKDHRPLVIFRYHPSRSGEVAQKILASYQGFLQTDGYNGYLKAGNKAGIVHVGCWAHIRREFKEALDIADGKDTVATQALDLIGELYELETTLRMKLIDAEITAEEFQTIRSRRAQRILSRIEEWLDEQQPRVTPTSQLGKAIAYAKGQFERAKRYHEHILLTPDNNPIERTIRPFVTGRKNWLFADTALGAHASMGLYTMVMTAKTNGLDPAEYLIMLFDQLPRANDEADLRALLPYEYAKAQGVTPGGYFPALDSANGEN